MFLPAVIALVAENIGHVKSVGQMTETEVDPMIGRAMAADGVATTLAGFGGGSAATTYAENIGVMAATRVYSTAAYWVAAVVAIVLAMCPKVGARSPRSRRACWAARRSCCTGWSASRHPDLADQ